jgi:two-component system alkaline phosphatase synthesis response regulator PhoP
MNESILLIEDEEALRMTLEDRLRNEGYRVDQAADGAEGLEKATTLAYDLLILDLMLPQRNGLDLCREIRQAGLATPILILTARGQTVDKVVGLKLGADDYVTKPFEMMELMARVEVLLRRAHPKAGVAPNAQEFGEIHVDWKGTEVTRGGTPVALSAREFQLLRYFCEHPGQTLSRADILREVWGYKAETFTRTVDVHVASLRQKLENDPRKPALIMTVQGLGYKFVR